MDRSPSSGFRNRNFANSKPHKYYNSLPKVRLVHMALQQAKEINLSNQLRMARITHKLFSVILRKKLARKVVSISSMEDNRSKLRQNYKLINLINLLSQMCLRLKPTQHHKDSRLIRRMRLVSLLKHKDISNLSKRLLILNINNSILPSSQSSRFHNSNHRKLPKCILNFNNNKWLTNIQLSPKLAMLQQALIETQIRQGQCNYLKHLCKSFNTRMSIKHSITSNKRCGSYNIISNNKDENYSHSFFCVLIFS